MAIKITVFNWWRVKDRRNSNKVTWCDLNFFRLLAAWECFIGKICHAIILSTGICSNRSKYFLISVKIILKPEVTKTCVIFSSAYWSVLTNVIFKWIRDHISYSWYITWFFNSEHKCWRILLEHKKKTLTRLLKNHASDCWTIVPVTAEQLCQRLLNNRASNCWIIVPLTLEEFCQWLLENHASNC